MYYYIQNTNYYMHVAVYDGSIEYYNFHGFAEMMNRRWKLERTLLDLTPELATQFLNQWWGLFEGFGLDDWNYKPITWELGLLRILDTLNRDNYQKDIFTTDYSSHHIFLICYIFQLNLSVFDLWRHKYFLWNANMINK
jgi:hypothetical protein